MDPENRFLELLTRFNRKERFYLIGMALGNRDFRLSDDFREQLAARLALPVREDSFVAMDYHLNWLYAAAHFASNGSEPLGSPHCENPLIEDGEGLRIVQSNQEDIDLVIASLQGGICHLILIEAKGVTSWSNKELSSKARRLKAIFGEDGRKFPGIQPHFVIVSPSEPRKLQTATWPGWMNEQNIPWLRMNIPPDLLVVTRCTGQGAVSQSGDHWKVIPEKSFTPDTSNRETEAVA